jgi:hypothetical protein
LSGTSNRRNWHGGYVIAPLLIPVALSSCRTSSSTRSDEIIVSDVLNDAECVLQSGTACEEVVPPAPLVELVGTVCADLAYELSVCWIENGLEDACLALFSDAGLESCPGFSDFVVETGWVAGDQGDIALAEVSRCMSATSSLSYDVYFWSEVEGSPFPGQVLYSNFAYFDSVHGSILSLQRYQTNPSRAVYPEVYCCDGERTFGIAYGLPVECDFESSVKYDPSDFMSR